MVGTAINGKILRTKEPSESSSYCEERAEAEMSSGTSQLSGAEKRLANHQSGLPISLALKGQQIMSATNPSFAGRADSREEACRENAYTGCLRHGIIP